MANETEKKTSVFHAIVLIILMIMVVFLAFEVISLKREKDTPVTQKTSQTQPVVNVSAIMTQKVTVRKKYIGYVTPIHSVSILPFISGFVQNIPVKSGQTVQAGELLMTLEQGEYKAQLDLSKAGVMQATATLENASTYFKRVQAAGTKAIAHADFDKAQAAFLTAKAGLAQAQAQLAAAKVNYDYTVIRAPISGLIGTVEPTKGDYVSPAGSPLMTIIQTSPIKVVFSITDKDYIQSVQTNGPNDLLTGERIKIQLANGEIYPSDGTFRYAENALNRPTNSIAVYADFENKDNVLISNSYVTVYLEKNLSDVVLIPQTQVNLTPEGTFVTIADNRSIRSQAIEILGTQGSDYIVKNTFNPQEYIVSGKPPVLKENQSFKLNILPPSKE